MDSSVDVPPLPHATTASVTGFEVSGYSCNGDPTFLDNHVYSIRIWVAQDNYEIRRTYSNFCMFDNHLRKKYARTELPPLPLSGAALFVKASRRKSSMGAPPASVVATHRPSATGIRQSFHGLMDGGKRKMEVKRVDHAEPIAQKKDALTSYLKHLIAIPVIALSRELMDFFDEESPDGFEFERPELSEIDMLLVGEEAQRTKVKSSLDVPLDVAAGSVVVWRFTTERKDIGFTVEFGGQVAAPYQRCNSHEVAVTGVFEAPAADTVKLIWDNSYSKVTSKILLYYVKVVTKGEFEHIKTTLGELVRQQRGFDMRRNALRAAFEKICEKLIISGTEDLNEEASLHSMSVLSSIGAGGSVSTGQARGGGSLLSELQQEIHRLQDADRAMRMELSAIQFTLHERNEEVDILREEHDRGLLATEQLEAERETLQKSFDQASRDAASERNMRIKLEQQLENVKRERNLELADTVARLQRDLRAFEAEKVSLDAKCGQLKAEKKQLKIAALKFKSDLEAAEKRLEVLAEDKTKLQESNEKLLNIKSSTQQSGSSNGAPRDASSDKHTTSSSNHPAIDPDDKATLIGNIEHKNEPENTKKSEALSPVAVSGRNSRTMPAEAVPGKAVNKTRRRRRIVLENSFGF